jgi:hypothetical protein
MKILNLEFDFLFQFESNSNLASTIIQRINSSTRLLFINFEVYMQNLVQFTHKQGHTEWTGPRTRSARHNARARDITRARDATTPPSCAAVLRPAIRVSA